MSLVIMLYFTSSMLSMFRTLIHPSSGAYVFSIESPHWSCALVSMCVGVSMWLVWGGIRVAGQCVCFSRTGSSCVSCYSQEEQSYHFPTPSPLNVDR